MMFANILQWKGLKIMICGSVSSLFPQAGRWCPHSAWIQEGAVPLQNGNLALHSEGRMVIRVSEHTEVVSGSPTALGASAGPTS